MATNTYKSSPQNPIILRTMVLLFASLAEILFASATQAQQPLSNPYVEQMDKAFRQVADTVGPPDGEFQAASKESIDDFSIPTAAPLVRSLKSRLHQKTLAEFSAAYLQKDKMDLVNNPVYAVCEARNRVLEQRLGSGLRPVHVVIDESAPDTIAARETLHKFCVHSLTG